ncbi:hypothetical protein LCGC14_0908350, partial [marine sediment metagenome]
VAWEDYTDYGGAGTDVDIFYQLKISNIISFEISEQYLNTTTPLETDLGLEINCSVSAYSPIEWVYLSENSSGVFENRSMSLGVNGEWTYVVDISGLNQGDKLVFLFYSNDSNNILGKNDNLGSNFSILIGDFYSPIINFEISDTYLNSTRPLETDLSLEINCSVFDISTIEWVYLSENSTGVFINRSMSLGVNGEWTYTVNISALVENDQLMFSFSANDSYNNIGYLDNGGFNFSILIGDYYRDPIYISGNDNFTSENGVRNPWASGTKQDPYIIENWIIDALGGEFGILIQDSDVYFRIENCTVYNSGNTLRSDASIKFVNVTHGNIFKNNLSNTGVGIYSIMLKDSFNNTIIQNNATNNNNVGIFLWVSDNNTIAYNNASNNGQDGIYLETSSFNIIKFNNFAQNSWNGIILRANSHNNTIFWNKVSDSGTVGISIRTDIGPCNNNLIYYNWVINNNVQSQDDGTNNQWDNGTMGNYWSDYEGMDIDDDGIGDFPYNIPGTAGSKDNFPIWDDGHIHWTMATEVVSTESAGESNWPAIALDGAGNIHVVWDDYTNYGGSGTDKDIFYKLKNATTGTWTTTEVISTESTGGSWYPKIAVDGARNIHVVWVDFTNYGGSGTDLDIFYKFKNATTGIWTTTEVVSTESMSESNWPTIALGGAGNIHVAWMDDTNYDGSGTDRDIFYKFRNATTEVWTATEVVSTESTGNSWFPTIDMDGAGNIHVTWSDYTDYSGSGTDLDIFYKFKNATTGIWTTTEVVSTESTGESNVPTFALDGAGNIHIAWHDLTVYGGSGTDMDIFYKYKNATTGVWTATEVISTESTGDSNWPTIAADGTGNINMAWLDLTVYGGSGIDRDIFYKFKNANTGTWKTTEIVSTESTDDSIYPKIIVDGAGYIHVVWVDKTNYSDSGTDWDVFYKLKNVIPIINFEISQQYLNTTTPLETDLALEINCSITSSSNLKWVYLSENSTGVFINRSMSLSVNGEWTYIVDISGLDRGDKLMFSFYANDSNGNIGQNNNNGLNFSVIIGDFLLPYSNISYQILDSPNYISKSTLFTLNAADIGQRPSGLLNVSFRIDSGSWNLYTNPFNLTGYSHGNHTIYYYATDIAGNTEVINQESVFLDIQGPNITFSISPLYLSTTTPQYYHTELTINCSTQDNVSVIWVYLCENSTGTFLNRTMSKLNGSYTFNLDISSLNWSDLVVFSFYGNDSAGNINWNNNGGLNYAIEIYDFQDPSSNLSFQAIKNPNFVSNSTLFNFNGTDNGNGSSGVYNISYRIDLGGWSIYSTPFNLAGYSHGNHTIYYYATDNAGNSEVMNQEIIFIDIKKPNITFSISPLYLSTTTPEYYHTDLQISCIVQDNTSIIWVYLNENSTGFFLNHTMSYLSGKYTFNLNITSLNWSNTILFSFYANDSAGNINWNNNGGLNYTIQIYDFQDPSTNISFQLNENPNFVSTSTQFVFNANDGNGSSGSSGVYNISYRIDSGGWSIYSNPFNLGGYSHGNHTIYYYTTDNAGNTEIINQETIFLDRQEPNITFSISPLYLSPTTPQYFHTELKINCTVQDDASIIWVYLSENSTGTFVNRTMSMFNGSYTFNLDISSLNWSNTLMLSFYANDSAGNIQWDNNGGLYHLIQIYDFQDPVTSIGFTLSFNPNFVRNFTLFSLLTNDNIGIGGSGEKTIGYNIDGNGWNNFIVPFNLSGYNEGLHTIYFNATDHAGNIEFTNQITIYLDINNISSSLDFIYYEDSGIKYVNNFSQFTIIWNDGTGSGLQNIYYKIDSGPFSPYSVSFDLLGYSEGFHNISYYSIDNVGNIEPEKSVIMYLDIAALDLNINYNVIYGLNYVDENTNISITSVEDLGSGVKNVQFKFDEGIWINGTIFDLKGLAFGEHTIHYRVEDNIGNFNEKSETLFLVTFVSDLDNDGLTYQEELSLSTDPFDEDTDGDKLSDGDEVNLYKTNPHSQDSDGDGYSDYDEIFKYGTDPNSALSSPTMNITIFIAILSTITISGYVGVKKWKVVHRKRVEDEVITLISEDKNKVLEHNVLNERLHKVKSKLNFEKIGKKRGVNGQYILNGALFVKDIGIEKFETLINDIVKKIYDQNLSKREDVNLIKLNIKDLEQNEKLMEFIKKLKGERE